MPKILKCDDCEKEVGDNPSAGLSGVGWIQEPVIGGTRVLCPRCQRTNEDYLINQEMEMLKEMHIERARHEADNMYTLESVRKLREERKNQFKLVLGKPEEL